MKKYFYIIIFSLLLISCSRDIIIDDAVTGSPVYPMFGEIPERNFYVPINVSDSLKLLWEDDVNGSFGNTSVTAFSDYIFVPDRSGRVYAFNLKSGEGVGMIKYKGAVNPAPIVDLNKIVFPVAEIKNNKTNIRVYDFKKGKEIQNFEIRGIVLSEIIKLKDGFIFLTENGKVMRYSYSSGKDWEYVSGEFIHSSPAYTNGIILFGNDKGEVITVNAGDGSVKLRKKVGVGFEGGFTISGTSFLAGDIDGIIYCGDVNSGEIKWKFNTGSRINTTPVLDEQYVYVCNLDGDLYKLNKSDGKKVWHTRTKGILNVTPLAFKNYLLVPDLNKKLLIVDTQTGKIANTLQFDSRAKLVPVYYGNTLILGADDGKIFAYEFVN